jgi:hypothetical protein
VSNGEGSREDRDEESADDGGGPGRLRFLSPEWFDQVAASRAGSEGSVDCEASSRSEPAAVGAPLLVVEQVVLGTPYGEVRYRVEVGEGSAVLVGPHTRAGKRKPAGAPAVTITSDWDTACSLAAGELSSERALLEGRLKVRGDLGAIPGIIGKAGGVDALPAEVRARTTFR